MKNQSTLRSLYDKFIHLPFPKEPKNEYLTDWLAELADLDGFYAGLAESLLKGKNIRVKNFPSLQPLFQSLKELHHQKKISKAQYQKFERYLSVLNELAKFIQAHIS